MVLNCICSSASNANLQAFRGSVRECVDGVRYMVGELKKLCKQEQLKAYANEDYGYSVRSCVRVGSFG